MLHHIGRFARNAGLRGPKSSPAYFRRAMSTPRSYDPSKIRNVAIIAHVDHGKTTLMDKLLESCAPSKETQTERAMDSNEHEKERGITITSKYTRLYHGEHVLHVVDTPGHADFEHGRRSDIVG